LKKKIQILILILHVNTETKNILDPIIKLNYNIYLNELKESYIMKFDIKQKLCTNFIIHKTIIYIYKSKKDIVLEGVEFCQTYIQWNPNILLIVKQIYL